MIILCTFSTHYILYSAAVHPMETFGFTSKYAKTFASMFSSLCRFSLFINAEGIIVNEFPTAETNYKAALVSVLVQNWVRIFSA